LYFIVLSGFLALSARAGFLDIPEGDCAIGIIKSTPQTESSLPFEFNQAVNGVESEITVFSNTLAPSDFVFVSDGGTVSYTELPQEGWTLEDIQCVEGAGVDITKNEDSVTFECVQPSGQFSAAFCVFGNRVSADKIPTLSEWGMITAAAGLSLIGVFFAVRRRKSFSA
jgi:hypothetical protein